MTFLAADTVFQKLQLTSFSFTSFIMVTPRLVSIEPVHTTIERIKKTKQTLAKTVTALANASPLLFELEQAEELEFQLERLQVPGTLRTL